MQSFDFPQLTVAQVGRCSQDNGRTHTQLPNGEYLCPACIARYRERGWLDAAFEFTDAYFAAHPPCWGRRLRRKVAGGMVVDPEQLVVELRRLVASGVPVALALRRLQAEAHVGYFLLAPAVTAALGVEPKKARRLVVQAVGSGWSGNVPR
jgi:hypothetical protein